ncbi:MAG: hypothetical protein J07HX64_02313 [halophilic archaeon J07HX64]|nr:MAG: hypothetical protein J07HX64_02313 [halophilic archaeon J07HX64]
MLTRGNICVFPGISPSASDSGRLSGDLPTGAEFGDDSPTVRVHGDSRETYQNSYDTRLRCESNSHGISERTLTGCEPLARAILSAIHRSGFQ